MTVAVFEDFAIFLARSLRAAFTPPLRVKEFIAQLEFVSWQSLPVILFCLSFAAIVTVMESAFHMRLVVQNDSMVPGFASLLILRELGVVVSSLLLTSRVGAGLAAEVGTMQVTEQVDALRMLGIDPIRYLVVPRLLACISGGVILSLIANLVCLYCAMLVCELRLGYSSGSFLSGMRAFVGYRDLIFAMIKGGTFGAVIPLVSCFFGFRCQSGAEGVGLATTNSVVAATVTIIVLDFVLSYTFSHFY